MNKKELIKKYGLINYPNSIEVDSRKIKIGDMFVAIKGKFADGNDHITNAIQNGASIIVGKRADNTFVNNIQFIHMEDTFDFLNRFSYDYYSSIIEKMTIYGITGTNGKTSTTYFLREILGSLGISTTVIGTISTFIGNEEYPSANTTPYASELYKIFKKSYNENIKHIIMEISSHGLEENRIYGLNFNIGGITNITQDHLDFHKTMDNYINAKMKITEHMKNTPLIVNIDDINVMKLLKRTDYKNIVTVGEGGDYEIKSYELHIDSSFYTILYNNIEFKIKIFIPGLFSVYNSLMAIIMAHKSGIPIEKAIIGVGKLKSVPGRFEIIRNKEIISVVDYAHTPDALSSLLNSVKELPHERIITVFGAGGDRDKTKRSIMGKIADKNSDILIVTSDNPRTEDPAGIINDILTGIKRVEGLFKYIDREEAIKKAVEIAKKGDIIVIAGKGHEDYQIIGNKKIHFSDQEILKELLDE
ncbi:UDP-N-acetylmuramoyl-L-alanyl-D-glutamate--2,6-diaminopimelate ligase [bacterium]|nr:UDP-N-acetylmuramoyl-L-alanyl-D-glutamate--2,6-diaminopimelate ligase [bacterium]